ncbi:kinase-like domain-containing protein [Rhodocollybia butyracea]|uniref:Kinase-like domain-containing protein n=1 Tax=Rhodocollybia butyracea TaxID=206335 RepID=A0A9P5Q5T1_9AGAR|nr:kinase-like domain-containing protein [Rhodocollybia butyracea]
MNISQRKFELDLGLQTQAIALANPKLETIRINSNPLRTISTLYMSGSQKDYYELGVSVFLVNSKFSLYDSGCLAIVTYEYNESVSQCLENGMLRKDLTMRPIPPTFFVEEIQAKLNLKNIAEHVTLKTGDDGQVIIDVRPFRLGCLLPQGLNHPTVLLSELRRQPYDVYPNVDVVTLASESGNNTHYAFKQLSFVHDRFGSHSSYSYADINPLLEQAQFLFTHPLPFIIHPTALVIDSSGDFRGYLMPFHPAQSLDKVLERLIIPMKPNLVLDSKHAASLTPADCNVISTAQTEGAGRESYPMALQWCLKLAWVLDIVQAINVLHEAMLCCGDIKLENIVLCVDGHCRLIDLLPRNLGYTTAYLAPEVTAIHQSTEDDPAHSLTFPRDVFAVGMLLWALVEEIGCFERKDPLYSPSLVWSGSVPLWYRELVDCCIAQEPEDRPSVYSVLEILSEHWIQ